MTNSNYKAVKAIHFADLHLGVENYGKPDPATGLNQRVIDFLANLKYLVDRALDQSVDLVVFSGDAYKNQRPSPTLQREFAKQIKRLTKAGTEVFLLVGNHDLPQAEKQAHALSVFSALEVERVTVGRRIDIYPIDTRGGPVDVVAVPYISRAALLAREHYSDLSPSEVEQLIAEEIDRQIGEFALRLRPDVPAVLAAHLSVSTATYGSERSAVIGSEMTVAPSSLARAGFDYVALGHIHKHQDLTVGYPPIAYPGSLDRIDFGEEREEKGFCLVSLAKGATSYEFVKVPARPFTTINVECKSDRPTEEILAEVGRRDLTDAVVRLRAKVPAHRKEQVRMSEIRRALDGAYSIGPIEIELEGEERRGRNPNLSEDRGPLEALEQYILTREDLKPRKKELTEAAKELIEELLITKRP